MLRSLDDLKRYGIHATDGDIGQVKDFYFDDERWAVRYLIVQTGNWLMGRKVLISPISIGKPDWETKKLPVRISVAQVKNSPNINTDRPVSRQHEGEFVSYYGYPNYWDGDSLWGTGMYPGVMMSTHRNDHLPPDRAAVDVSGHDRPLSEPFSHAHDNVHLRSCQEVIDYHIHASDGQIGQVSGMLVDEKTWAIRYLVIDTSKWLKRHEVLIAPQWLDKILWPERQVTVNLTREQIQNSTAYDDTVKLDRHRETELYQHYGRVGYWEKEKVTSDYAAQDN